MRQSTLFPGCFVGPSLPRCHDFGGHSESCVQLEVLRFRGRRSANPQGEILGGGENDRTHLVRPQRLADRRPRGVHALIEQSLLNRDQQMIGQHTQKNVRVHAHLFAMKNGPLFQRTLEGAKRRLRTSQENVDPPSFFRAQIVSVRLQQIILVLWETPVESGRWSQISWAMPSSSLPAGMFWLP